MTGPLPCYSFVPRNPSRPGLTWVCSQVRALPLAPVQGVVWIAERLRDAAEGELYDPSVVRAQLAALNEALDAG